MLSAGKSPNSLASIDVKRHCGPHRNTPKALASYGEIARLDISEKPRRGANPHQKHSPTNQASLGQHPSDCLLVPTLCGGLVL